tara:strand:- start:3301 stop:3972 length:672 start_codon:yes stop_codon:yes gene_type:complete
LTDLTEALITKRFAGMVLDAPTHESALDDAWSNGLRKQFLSELDASGRDLWVFSYGSLLWQGEVDTPEHHRAVVHGWHRRFCLLQWAWRGDLNHPCLMLALDRGGCCHGRVYRVPGPNVSEAMAEVWDREMSGDGYRPRWVRAKSEDQVRTALTFVMHRSGDRYAGRLSDAETAELIAKACGHAGACAEYLRRTQRALQALGISDHHLNRLEKLVACNLEHCT